VAITPPIPLLPLGSSSLVSSISSTPSSSILQAQSPPDLSLGISTVEPSTVSDSTSVDLGLTPYDDVLARWFSLLPTPHSLPLLLHGSPQPLIPTSILQSLPPQLSSSSPTDVSMLATSSSSSNPSAAFCREFLQRAHRDADTPAPSLIAPVIFSPPTTAHVPAMSPSPASLPRSDASLSLPVAPPQVTSSICPQGNSPESSSLSSLLYSAVPPSLLIPRADTPAPTHDALPTSFLGSRSPIASQPTSLSSSSSPISQRRRTRHSGPPMAPSYLSLPQPTPPSSPSSSMSPLLTTSL
jgi:hypothetical protein